jgi:hypothetical protein
LHVTTGDAQNRQDGDLLGYQLTKQDGTVYDLAADLSTCDCPDFTANRTDATTTNPAPRLWAFDLADLLLPPLHGCFWYFDSTSLCQVHARSGERGATNKKLVTHQCR